MIVEQDGCIAYIESGPSQPVPYLIPSHVFIDSVCSPPVLLTGDPIVSEGDWGRIVALFYETPVTEGWIEDLEVGYLVRQPIPYAIERIGEGDYLASFSEANIAIGGANPQDAYQALVAEILDTFDLLTAEQHLHADAAAQRQVLEMHIVKTQPAD